MPQKSKVWFALTNENNTIHNRFFKSENDINKLNQQLPDVFTPDNCGMIEVDDQTKSNLNIQTADDYLSEVGGTTQQTGGQSGQVSA